VQRGLISSGSKGIAGVWKARTGKQGVETMMTEHGRKARRVIIPLAESAATTVNI